MKVRAVMLAKVQSSNNSANSSDGSLKCKYNSATEVGTPRISPLIRGITPNTDYTLSDLCAGKKMEAQRQRQRQGEFIAA